MQPAQALEHAWEADSFFKLSLYLTIPFPRQLRLLKTGMASPRMAQIEVLRMVTGKESGVQCEVFQPPRFGIPRDLGQFFLLLFHLLPIWESHAPFSDPDVALPHTRTMQREGEKTWENLGRMHKENNFSRPRLRNVACSYIELLALRARDKETPGHSA